MQNWKLCETGLADCALKLEEIKARLKIPLPEKIEDLKTHEQLTKVMYASDSSNSELNIQGFTKFDHINNLFFNNVVLFVYLQEEFMTK